MTDGSPTLPLPFWKRPNVHIACISAITLIPFVVLAIITLSRGYTSTSDMSLIELRIRDLSRSLPLTGVYSRFGYQHPGPAMFYMLWVPYQIFGRTGAALIVGMLAWAGGLSALVVALIGRHHGRPAAGVTLFTVLVGLIVVGWNATAEPWNPNIMTFGGPCLLALTLLSNRSVVAAALVPVIASIILQSHLGAGVFVVLLMLFWCVEAARQWRQTNRSDESTKLLKGRFIGTAVAVVVWVPPLFDQFWRTGNLGRILSSMRSASAGQQAVGWPNGLRMSTMSWAAPPWWARGNDGIIALIKAPSVDVPWFLIVSIALIVATIVMARDDRRRSAIRTAIVVACVFAAIPITFSSIRGPAFSYLIEWLPGTTIAILGLAATMFIGTIGTRVAVDRRASFAAAVVVALSVAASGTHVLKRTADYRFDQHAANVALDLWKQLSPKLAASKGPIFVKSDYNFSSMVVVPTFAILGDNEGKDVVVEDRIKAAVIPARVATSAPTELTVLSDGSANETIAKNPRGVVAMVNPFTPTELADLKKLWRSTGEAAAKGDKQLVDKINFVIQNAYGDRHLVIVLDTKITS